MTTEQREARASSSSILIYVYLLVALTIVVSATIGGLLIQYRAETHRVDSLASDYHLTTRLAISRLESELNKIERNIKAGFSESRGIQIRDRDRREITRSAFIIRRHTQSIEAIQRQFAHPDFEVSAQRLTSAIAKLEKVIAPLGHEPPFAESFLGALNHAQIRCEQLRQLHMIAFREQKAIVRSRTTSTGFSGLLAILLGSGCLSILALLGFATHAIRRQDQAEKVLEYRAVEAESLHRAVTEATESLRQRDQAFRTAITPIVFADLEGRITEANQAFANLFGFESTEQVIGQLNTSFHSEPISIAQINKLILEGGFNGEVTSKRVDGTPIDLQISATRFADANGRPIGSMATFMDVTPRRKVERALRDSEERLRQSEQRLQQLISNCPAALYTCEASGDFGATFVSKTITSQLGYETREFIDDARFWVNHIHPEDREHVLAELSKVFETGHHSYEYRFLHKDGTYRWMYDQSSLLLGSDGNPEEIVGFWMDITEQKRAEEVETNLGRIVEESLNEVYIFDAETQYFLVVNRGARENLGYSMEELKRLTPLDLKPDYSPETFAEVTQQLRSGEKQLVPFITRHCRKDGSLYDVEVHLQMATFQGLPVFVAIILDISDRIGFEKARSQRVLEAELLYKAVAMADETDSLEEALQECVDIVCKMTAWEVGHAYVPSPNGARQLEPTQIWQFTDEQRFTKLREVTEQTPFAMGEDLPGRIWKSGQPAWIVNVQEDSNFPRNSFGEDLCVKGAFGFPVKIKGETLAILEFFSEQEVERNDTLLLLVRSVGEQVGRVIERKEAAEASRRQHELVARELDKAKKELVLRTRLAAVGQMSAQVAHELRNPLGAVSNAVYYLQRHVPASEEKWSEYLHLIDNEVTTCNRFIGELLDVTRAKAPIRQTTNLAHLVERVLTRHDVPQRVDIQLVCDPDPFEIFADNDQIVQVLDNLLQNALDASGQKAARIKIRAYRDAESDIITVQDAGSGIPPEHRASVFDVLFTTKSSGTGLGLPICKQIIEKHGGTIELLDELSPGTTFQIRLPRALVYS